MKTITKLEIIISSLDGFQERINEFIKYKKVISIKIRKGRDNSEEQGGHYAYIIYEEEII